VDVVVQPGKPADREARMRARESRKRCRQ
jgi:hypothetical protein